MELILLCHLPSPAVPDDGSPVNAAAQQKVPLSVPLQGEDWAFMSLQALDQLTCMARSRAANLSMNSPGMPEWSRH